MFKRAFKQYVQNNKAYQYGFAGKCDAFFIALTLYLCTSLWAEMWWLVQFGEFPSQALIAVLYLAVGVAWWELRPVVGGILYALQFLGNYEVIDRSFGYKAFRINREQQEYHGLYYERFPKRQERIIASACLSSDGTIWAVLAPGRHHHCIWFMAQYNANEQVFKQGFLTNQYRYICREEARAMAIQNGQAPTPDHSRDLFSEDLWDTPEHLQYKG